MNQEYDEDAQRGVLNGSAGNTQEGMTGGAQGDDRGCSDATGADLGTPSSASSGTPAAEGGAASGTGAETSAEAAKESMQDASTYTQEFVDRLKALHDRDKQFSENRLREVEAQLKDLEDRFRRQQRFDDAVKSIYIQLGDATPGRLNAVVVEMARLKQQAEEAKDVKNELEGARSQFKTVEKMFLELSEKNRGLNDSHRELVAQYQKLQADYQAEVSVKNDCQQQLKSWETVGSRMIAAFAPFCLKERDWFLELLSELQDEVYKDPPSDAAILMFASLAELAVMERNSAAPCLEWKKQLEDMGLVVANYMHQKKSAEGDVLKMLHNFAQAFQDMPMLKKLKIGIRIPSLGGDFKTDEVKHKNKGSIVAKVLSWCVVEDGHVYCKAIVE